MVVKCCQWSFWLMWKLSKQNWHDLKNASRIWSNWICEGQPKAKLSSLVYQLLSRRRQEILERDFMSRKWQPPGFHVPWVPSTFSTILNEMCRSGLDWLGLRASRAFQRIVAHPGQEESRRSECEHSDVVLEIDGTDDKVAKLRWQKNAS